MTIEEAIKSSIETAEEYEGLCRVNKFMGTESCNDELMKCADKLRQVAEWLIELKGCYEVYSNAKDILAKGENETAEDSSDRKKAYAVVTSLKEIFEHDNERVTRSGLHDAE